MILNGTHVGYTGTSRGMTDNQMTRLRNIFISIKETQAGPHKRVMVIPPYGAEFRYTESQL